MEYLILSNDYLKGVIAKFKITFLNALGRKRELI